MNTARRRSTKKVHSFLEKMNTLGELIPGAAARLSEMGHDLPDAGQCLGELIAYLHGEGKTYLSTHGKAALKELPPLQFLLERLPLRKGSVEELTDLLAADLVEFSPADQAKITMDRLRQPGMVYHFATDGPPTVWEQRARAVLHVFRDSLRSGLDLDDLAARWTEEIGHLPFHKACQRVARKLERPETAAELTAHGRPLDFDTYDPLFQPLARDEEADVMEGLIGEVEEIRTAPAREKKRFEEELAATKKKLAAAQAEGRALDERIRAREAQLSRR